MRINNLKENKKIIKTLGEDFNTCLHFKFESGGSITVYLKTP